MKKKEGTPQEVFAIWRARFEGMLEVQTLQLHRLDGASRLHTA